MPELHPVPETEEYGRLGSLPSDLDPAAADGSIEVREGRLYVADPGQGGAHAVLIPAPPLRLWLNGVELQSPSPVRSSDRIEWERAAAPL